MSWREILGANTPSTENPCAHNTHNTQKPVDRIGYADSESSAYGYSKVNHSKLQEVISDVCQGLSTSPNEIQRTLSKDEIKMFLNGDISIETVKGYARALAQRREMYQGKRPDHYTKHATCKHCGPIWLWFSGEVLGCPWCWNRIAGKPIPRPT